MEDQINFLRTFLSYVDNNTYILDDVRYDEKTNEPITKKQLAENYLLSIK